MSTKLTATSRSASLDLASVPMLQAACERDTYSRQTVASFPSRSQLQHLASSFEDRVNFVTLGNCTSVSCLHLQFTMHADNNCSPKICFVMFLKKKKNSSSKLQVNLSSSPSFFHNCMYDYISSPPLTQFTCPK